MDLCGVRVSWVDGWEGGREGRGGDGGRGDGEEVGEGEEGEETHFPLHLHFFFILFYHNTHHISAISLSF